VSDTNLQISKWLSPPDPSSNLNAALEERKAETGLWLLESYQFVRWKTTNRSLLWLFGKPGCGKTILASTAIENVTQYIQARSNQAVAYFYFTFRDADKQGPRNLLLSIISQLYSRSSTTRRVLDELFSTCTDGQRQPSIDELMNVLRQLINGFNETYIILDALDECEDPVGQKGRKGTLRCLEKVLGWKLDTLHVIITSRPEKDIEDILQPLLDAGQKICIQSALVDGDIRAYVRHKIRNGSGFARWKNRLDVQEEIESSLMARVDGM
jgi:hypothetical protein